MTRLVALAVLLIISTAGGCSSENSAPTTSTIAAIDSTESSLPDPDAPSTPSITTPVDSPETSRRGLDDTTAVRPALGARAIALLDQAADHSAAHGGLTTLIRYGGEVVYERYEQGTDAGDPHNLFSGTKSFNCAIAIAASEDGLLDLDDPVSDSIGEWRNDPDLSTITIRQLLSLSSGIEGGLQGDIVSYEDAVTRARMKVEGERLFDYGPDPFQIFGAIMTSKLADTDEDVLEYLTRRVFEPIGLEYRNWRREPADQPRLSAGAFLTAENWSRFGQLVANSGTWEGTQVLDPKLLAECLRPGSANPNYGMTFWLPTRREGFGSGGLPSKSAERCQQIGCPDDLAKAAGVGGQYLYISQSLNMVVVRQTAGPQDPATEGFSDIEFLGPILEAIDAS